MYYRATKMSGTVYYRAFNDMRLESQNIEDLVGGGDVVIIADDLEEIAEIFGVLMTDLVDIDSA